MAKYSKEDILRIVEEEDVEFIRLQFTDIFGMIKNVAITSSQLEKALENRCTFDGAAIEGFGGDTTCLAVNIEAYPTHIAGLPCAVNLGCHVTRHASLTL